MKLVISFFFDRLGETCEIMIEVYVHKDTAWTFNSGQDKMEDILVLNLKGGKDLFVSFVFGGVFTARNSSCGKVMFSQVSAHGGGGCLPTGGGVCREEVLSGRHR